MVGGLEYHASARSTEIEYFSSGLPQPVLYDPGNPPRNIVVNNLPGNIRLGEGDEFASPSPLRGALTMLLPTVAAAVNVVCGYYVLVARALG
jgi:hypothetical protein